MDPKSDNDTNTTSASTISGVADINSSSDDTSAKPGGFSSTNMASSPSMDEAKDDTLSGNASMKQDESSAPSMGMGTATSSTTSDMNKPVGGVSTQPSGQNMQGQTPVSSSSPQAPSAPKVVGSKPMGSTIISTPPSTSTPTSSPMSTSTPAQPQPQTQVTADKPVGGVTTSTAGMNMAEDDEESTDDTGVAGMGTVGQSNDVISDES